MRSALAIACLVTARFVPFLGLVMSLIGSFLTIAVSVIFPAACHLKLFKVRIWCCRLHAHMSLSHYRTTLFAKNIANSLHSACAVALTACFLQRKLPRWRVVSDVAVLSIGIVCALSGTAASLLAIMAQS